MLLLHKWKRQCEVADVRERLGLCKSVDNPKDFHPYPSRVVYALIFEIYV